MKITADDLKQLIEIINSAEEFRPAVHAVMQAIESYGPELAKYPKTLSLFNADVTTLAYQRYRDNGFNHKDALLLTINQKVALQELSRKMQQNSRSKNA